MKTRKFLEEMIDEDFMPVKVKAIELLGRMSQNEFEDVFIELSESFRMKNNELLNLAGRTCYLLDHATNESELNHNMRLQFGDEEEDG
jgi:hypothetical protein